MNKATIQWHCNYLVGVPGTAGTMMQACGTDFETKCDLIDWKMGDCAAICPRCGAALDHRYDEPYCLELEEFGSNYVPF